MYFLLCIYTNIIFNYIKNLSKFDTMKYLDNIAKKCLTLEDSDISLGNKNL